MPIAMNPDTTFRAVLTGDKDITPTPVFLYPFLTGIQQQRMLELYESIGDGNVGSQNMKIAFELAAMFLRGWENITHPETGEPLPFERATAVEQLMQICSVLEAMELAQQVMFAQSLDLLDKKKFASPSASATEASARPAPE